MGAGLTHVQRWQRGRPGWTLVEVVAGLVLAATLLVAMITAFRVHRRQMVRAVRDRAALLEAESLLASWHGSEIPRQASGWLVSGNQRWFWKTRPIQRYALGEGLFVESVRFEMFDTDRRGRSVVTVELLRPLPVAPRAAPRSNQQRGARRLSLRRTSP